MVRRFGGLTIINAGTLRREEQPCFLELDFEAASGLAFTFDPSGPVSATPELVSLADGHQGD